MRRAPKIAAGVVTLFVVGWIGFMLGQRGDETDVLIDRPHSSFVREVAGAHLYYVRLLRNDRSEALQNSIETRLWKLVPDLESITSDQSICQSEREAASRQLRWIAEYFSKHPRSISRPEQLDMAKSISDRFDQSAADAENGRDRRFYKEVSVSAERTFGVLDQTLNEALELSYQQDLEIARTLEEYEEARPQK